MNEFDILSAPLEIERKFLIDYPDLNVLQQQDNYRMIHIEQSYLEQNERSPGGRIRRITDGKVVRYIYTCKKKISDLTRYEYEKEITEDEYRELLLFKRVGSNTIIKDRHIFSYQGLIYELDIYEFWDDRATLEAEVESEDTPIPIPSFLRLIKEVTYDKRYNNSKLAYNHGIIEEKNIPES